MRYGIRATPHKSLQALDPAPFAWGCDGSHPTLEIAAAEPTTARALEARRVHRGQTHGEKGKPEPHVEEVDVWPVVVLSTEQEPAQQLIMEEMISNGGPSPGGIMEN